MNRSITGLCSLSSSYSLITASALLSEARSIALFDVIAAVAANALTASDDTASEAAAIAAKVFVNFIFLSSIKIC